MAIGPAAYEEEMDFMKDCNTGDQASSPGHSLESNEGEAGKRAEQRRKATPILPTRRMFTNNMLLVLLTAAIQEMHLIVASVAMPIFLSEPVSSREEELLRVLPFRFGGGAGFRPQSISMYSAVFG